MHTIISFLRTSCVVGMSAARAIYQFCFPACIAPPYHEVRVMTDPPLGPFPIGSTVTLQCSINPPPSEGVTYSWSTSIPSTNFYINQPNLTITIPTKHPSRGHYYCTVLNGSTEIGVGSTTIDVKGKLEVHILP